MPKRHERVIHMTHVDAIKSKHFPRNWPFVRGIHRSPVNFPHKGQWRGALMFSLICVLINDWVNNREAGDLRRYRAHYDVIVMKLAFIYCSIAHRASHQNNGIKCDALENLFFDWSDILLSSSLNVNNWYLLILYLFINSEVLFRDYYIGSPFNELL